MLYLLLTALGAAATYLLVVPVIVSFRFSSSATRVLRIRFFPFAFRIGTNGKKRVERATIEAKPVTGKRKEQKPSKKKRLDFNRLFFNESGTLRQVISAFLKSVAALFAARRHYLKVTMKGGFGSPDMTGIVSGLIEAARPLLGRKVRIVYQPDMTLTSLDGDVHVQAVIRVYRVLAEVVVLVYRVPKLKTAHLFMKIKKGEYHVRTA